jgi:long-chain-fatty-acid--[acyl-carrier-protein] ligase
MLNALLRTCIAGLMSLRYRVRVVGLAPIAARGRTGILFLPSHQALIDPILAVTVLHGGFRVRPLADLEGGMNDNPAFAWLAKRFGVRFMPLILKHGAEARDAVERVMRECTDGLRAGENILLYPAGKIMRTQREALGANSGVETLLRGAPETRVVLVRIRGLWGSSFSAAGTNGSDPPLLPALRNGLRALLLNGIVFGPRRTVTFEFYEPDDLPRDADRHTLNRYLEDFYNAEPLPRNTYVPYTHWDGGTRELPEPQPRQHAGNLEDVPAATREAVAARLRLLSGVETIADQADLARDLGLDSLARVELGVWLEQEYGITLADGDTLQTVADVLLAACGTAADAAPTPLAPPAPSWFAARDGARAVIPADAATIPELFLRHALRTPTAAIVADQASGVKSYRDLLTAVLALLPQVRALPGDAVGIMLPASVAACVAYLTVLFAGKTPVMVNWTAGARNLLHGLELTGVQRVITAQRLLSRLAATGVDLGDARERCVPLETLAAGITTGQKLRAALDARLNWSALRSAPLSPTAAVLFTSGSESLPKAVPLTHANIFANLRDVLQVVRLTEDDRLMACLPPFHSFGLTGNMVLALCAGVPAVFHTNPTEGGMIARLIETYRATMLIGTPTFLHGIVRNALPAQLSSLRLAVTGAEECPPRVYQALAACCPQATVLEGYGITECSPIVAVNDEANPRPGTIGRLLPSLESVLLDIDTGCPVAPGATGVLLVRGPSIFAGYLGDAPSPFADYVGQPWYRTGDLVSQDDAGILTFRGRLKRFVKIGGEMVSLPAIEGVLQDLAAGDAHDGPTLAVIATDNPDRPDLLLVTTVPLDRETVNARLRAAGLSGLHNIRQVISAEAIPVLGTGKTDYRSLQKEYGGVRV